MEHEQGSQRALIEEIAELTGVLKESSLELHKTVGFQNMVNNRHSAVFIKYCLLFWFCGWLLLFCAVRIRATVSSLSAFYNSNLLTFVYHVTNVPATSFYSGGGHGKPRRAACPRRGDDAQDAADGTVALCDDIDHSSGYYFVCAYVRYNKAIPKVSMIKTVTLTI